jgi:hypothetical protein
LAAIGTGILKPSLSRMPRLFVPAGQGFSGPRDRDRSGAPNALADFRCRSRLSAPLRRQTSERPPGAWCAWGPAVLLWSMLQACRLTRTSGRATRAPAAAAAASAACRLCTQPVYKRCAWCDRGATRIDRVAPRGPRSSALPSTALPPPPLPPSSCPRCCDAAGWVRTQRRRARRAVSWPAARSLWCTVAPTPPLVRAAVEVWSKRSSASRAHCSGAGVGWCGGEVVSE